MKNQKDDGTVEITSEGCEDCVEAKQAFILLNKLGFTKVNTMCTSCDTIYKLNNKKW